ncbi:hypothetical protein F4679DRAFT_494494 [Xylaria curta]|nr:hypothetical protein F4679DRAFT_494494 [Xylaria curta]
MPLLFLAHLTTYILPSISQARLARHNGALAAWETRKEDFPGPTASCFLAVDCYRSALSRRGRCRPTSACRHTSLV